MVGVAPIPIVLVVTGMDTLERVSRLQRSDLDQATLDGLRIMADRLGWVALLVGCVE
jgi:hypothetical protein